MKPPIYYGLMKYISKQRIQFTSPGHKGKIRMRADNLCKIDISDMPETDEILNPHGFILKSEEAIAGIFGAEKSLYLCGGASAGIYATLASVCKMGDKVIIDPECDKAVINALTILALRPVFLKRSYNRKYGINGGINTEELEYLTEQNSDAKIMIITSPTYYGVCANIKKAAEICHSRNILLMVDEGYGAHFNFSSVFPDTALLCRADIVVQNISRTLGAFSGSGLLHIGTDRVNFDDIREYLAIYQADSGSTSMLCAMENTVMYSFENEKKYKPLIKELEHGKSIINSTTDVKWFGYENNNNSDIAQTDIMRIVLNFSDITISTADAVKLFTEKFGIEPEASEYDNIIFCVSLYNSPSEIRKLVNSCLAIAKIAPPKKEINIDLSKTDAPGRIKVNVPPFKAYNCDGEKVNYKDAAGRICRKLIYKFPHGTPIIIPGEKITADHIDKISKMLGRNDSLSGINKDGEMEVLSLSDSFYF